MGYAEHNWNVVKHVFQSYVAFSNGRLVNVCLNPTIFEALSHALHKKRFCPNGRLRADDSLKLAIGNWLYTPEYGAFRNTNSQYQYKSNNKQAWQWFLSNAPDYSMSKALGLSYSDPGLKAGG